MTVFRRLTCTHYPDQRRRRERERERRREKRKTSSMQWSVHKEVFALNHSKISDTVPQIGSFVYSESEYTLESVSVSGRPFTR